MQKCIDGNRHKYRQKGKWAECVYCGLTRKPTKIQLKRWKEIERKGVIAMNKALNGFMRNVLESR